MKKNVSTSLVLSGSDVGKLLSTVGPDVFMDALIVEFDKACASFDPKETHIPIRSGFNYSAPVSGLVEWMPLYKAGSEVVLKLVGYHPANPESFGLPTIISTVYAYDTQTGHLKAVIDGVLLTAIRTGAASAVASKYLAHPKSETLGLIGCGAQAVTQLHALSRVFDLRTVKYFDTDMHATESFQSRTALLELDMEFKPASIEEIVSSSDILCTATSINVGSGPIFSGIEPLPHLHINAVGSDFPGKTELPRELLLRSLVCPDFKDQAMIEGECQQLEPAQVGPSLDELIKEQQKYAGYRTSLTVFDSTGWALEDQLALDLILDYADQYDLGVRLEIEDLHGDAKDPYSSVFRMSDIPAMQLNELLSSKTDK